MCTSRQKTSCEVALPPSRRAEARPESSDQHASPPGPDVDVGPSSAAEPQKPVAPARVSSTFDFDQYIQDTSVQTEVQSQNTAEEVSQESSQSQEKQPVQADRRSSQNGQVDDSGSLMAQQDPPVTATSPRGDSIDKAAERPDPSSDAAGRKSACRSPGPPTTVCPSCGNKVSRAKRPSQPRSKKRKQADDLWSDPGCVVGPVAPFAEIFQCLKERAGKDYAHHTSELKLLTELFFRFAGPDAFQQLATALSTVRDFDCDFTTTKGRVRALLRMETGTPLEKRAVLVSLRRESVHLQQQAHGEPYPDRVAMAQMVSEAFPDFPPNHPVYIQYQKTLQQNLGYGAKWVHMYERVLSTLWLLPLNMPITL